MKRYLKATNTRYRKQQNETNDCTVIALSIVARMTYKAAHMICNAFERKNNKRFPSILLMAALAREGFTITPIKNLKQKNGSHYTPKTIGNKLKRGYYLCLCSGHVFAVVNADVEDWTNNRNHRIKTAYKITRNRAI